MSQTTESGNESDNDLDINVKIKQEPKQENKSVPEINHDDLKVHYYASKIELENIDGNFDTSLINTHE